MNRREMTLEQVERGLIESVARGHLEAQLDGRRLDEDALRRLDVDRLETVRFRLTDAGVAYVEAMLGDEAPR